MSVLPCVTFNNALDRWADALREWVVSIRRYLGEIGSAGQKAYPSKWDQVLDDMNAADTLGAPKTDLLSMELFAVLMNVCDAFEIATRKLVAAVALITSPEVNNLLTRGMSRTYSENLRTFLRPVRLGYSAVQLCRQNALSAASGTGAAFGEAVDSNTLNAAYTTSTARGGLSTELYVSALVCGGSVALLSSAKDTALGIPADTVESAISDTDILAEYHPLQSMCYSAQPMISSIATSVATSAAASSVASSVASAGTSTPGVGLPVTVDLTFPQARRAVEYELELLTNRQRALKFGPLATAVTGLNYKLVERLRTIRASNMLIADVHRGPSHKLLTNAPMELTTDRGATALSIMRPGTWAPLAGCKPRVLAYAEAAGELIQAAVAAESTWGIELAVKFDKLATDGALSVGEGSPDALTAAIVAEFERDYDRNPPKIAKQFREMMIGDELDLSGYLARAAAQVGEAMADGSLRHELTAVGAARVPYADLARETRLTQVRASLDAAQSLWKRLRDTYRVDPDAFELSPTQKKATLIAGLRRSVEFVLRNNPVICSPPTLKLYAASRWHAPTAPHAKPPTVKK